MKKDLLIPIVYSIRSKGGLINFINHYWYGAALVVFIGLCFGIVTPSIDFLIILGYNLFLFLVVYEVGYLVNDLISVKTEAHPTMRIQDTFSIKDLNIIFLTRIIALLGAYGSLFIFFPQYVPYYLYTYSLYLLLVFVVYMVHDFAHLLTIQLRLITFTLLRILRWFVPIAFLFSLFTPVMQLMLIVFFISTHMYYLYDYALTKRIIKDFLSDYLPKRLESCLILFSFLPLLVCGIWLGVQGVAVFVFIMLFLSISCIIRSIVSNLRTKKIIAS